MLGFQSILSATVCIFVLFNGALAYHEDIYDYQYDEPTESVPTIRELVESNSLSFDMIEDLVTIAADWPLLAEISADHESLEKYNFIQTLQENGYGYEVEPNGESIKENSITITDDIIKKIKSLKTKMVPKYGLSEGCNNKLCDMMKYLFSCKTFNLGMRKTCADYLVGNMYQCTNYPTPEQFYDAPSTCLSEYLSFIAMLLDYAVKHGPALQNVISNYLTNDFTTNACGRTCYQHYQNASNTFYLQCWNQLAPHNASYPFVYKLLSNYQEFRNQGCDINNKNQSCYALLTTVYKPAAAVVVGSDAETSPAVSASAVTTTTLSSPDVLNSVTLPPLDTFSSALSTHTPQTEQITEEEGEAPASSSQALTQNTLTEEQAALVSATATPVLFTNYYCNYAGLNASVFDVNKAKTNMYVLQTLCAKMSGFGCCAGSMIQYLQQNQISVLQGGQPIVVPPCVLNYLSNHCPSMTNLATLCPTHSIASQTTIVANVTLQKTSTQKFPNVYNEQSVLLFQGTVSSVLAGFGFGVEPYHFLSTYPFQVMLTGYTYFNASKPLVKPNSGGMMYFPPGGDYTAATSGRFTYQLTVQNLNSTYIQQLTAVLQSAKYATVLGNAFGSQPPSATKTSTQSAHYTKAEPNNVAKNSAASSGVRQEMVWMVSGMVVMMMGMMQWMAL